MSQSVARNYWGPCEHGDCAQHYGDEDRWCVKCRPADDDILEKSLASQAEDIARLTEELAKTPLAPGELEYWSASCALVADEIAVCSVDRFEDKRLKLVAILRNAAYAVQRYEATTRKLTDAEAICSSLQASIRQIVEAYPPQHKAGCQLNSCPRCGDLMRPTGDRWWCSQCEGIKTPLPCTCGLTDRLAGLLTSPKDDTKDKEGETRRDSQC